MVEEGGVEELNMSATISAKAATMDIVLEEGAGLVLAMTKFDSVPTEMDLSTYSGRLTVRASTNSTTNLLELTTAAGDIVLSSGANNMVITFTEANITAATWVSGVYSFFITAPGSEPQKEIKGNIRIDQGT